MRSVLLVIAVLFGHGTYVKAQDLESYIDSCAGINAHDTVKTTCIAAYMSANYRKDLDGAIKAGTIAYKKASKRNNAKELQVYEGWLGYLYDEKGKYDLALSFTGKALVHRKEIGDKKGIVNAYNNIAHVQSMINNLDSASIYYQKAYDMLAGISDTNYIITIYNNISGSYEKMGKYGDAIELRYEALKLAELKNDISSMLSAYMGIGSCQIKAESYDMALESLDESRRMAAKNNMLIQLLQIDNHRGEAYEKSDNLDSANVIYSRVFKIVKEKNILPAIATLANNLGVVNSKQKKYDESIKYYEESIVAFRKLNQKKSLANSLRNVAANYRRTGNYSKAMQNAKEAYSICQEIGALELEMLSARTYAKAAYSAGEYNTSSKLFLEYIELRDSLQVDDQKKAINQLVAKYENEKKELMIENLKVKSASDSLQNAQTLKQNELIKAQKNTQRNLFITGATGLGLVAVLFILIAINRKKTNRKLEDQNIKISSQKDEIEEQRLVLEEKNTEIVDSINYAKRIQSAILPPDKLVKSHLDNSFVLYKPKDIVAGDFYWMEPVSNGILFAAADCTGHGVPGAMVSVVCNNALNRSVREHGLSQPGEILDKAREIVIAEFEKSEEEVKDGMDIALCSLVGTTLKFSGAHNPLWIIRKDAKEVEEIKAHKQPIGKYAEPSPFPTHTLNLNPGDSIYIFSDGYADQFGGQKGKKLKAKNFKELLLSIQTESMDRQHALIDEAFENWKGQFEQLDDVCVIGVRIS